MYSLQNINFGLASVDLHYRSLADTISGTRPLVLFVHGGGWEWLDENTDLGVQLFGQSLLDAGFILGGLAYRLDGWPAQMHDLRTCIRFLRANASKYRIDPHRIGLLGISAGAHMVGLHGMASECIAFDGEGYNDQPSTVKAICAISGPHDLAEYFRPGFWDAWSPTLKERAAQLAKDVFPSQCPEYLWLNSPRAYRGGQNTAWFIGHGTADEVVPFAQGVGMYAWLLQSGRDVTGMPIDGANHGLENCDRSKLVKDVVGWFKLKL